MKDFIARGTKKIISNQVKTKWNKLKTNVLENPKDIIDSLVKQISKALSGDTNKKEIKKAGKNVELAELMVGNLLNVAASDGGQKLIGTIVDIYAQHAARKQVSNFAKKIEEFNKKMEQENSTASNDDERIKKPIIPLKTATYSYLN